MNDPEIDLVIGTSERGAWAVLSVTGEIDLYTSPQLRDALTTAVDSGSRKLAVDLREVRFMDSMGLGVLIGARRKIAELDGSFALVCGEGPVRRVLDVSGLTQVFEVVGSTEDLPA